VNDKELPGIRGQAAESLGMLEYKKALPQLLKALEDSEIEVRFWAAFALGQIGDHTSIPHLQRLAAKDKSTLRGWWSVAKEAKDAIANINSNYCSI
jgi:HEAT repeat protein